MTRSLTVDDPNRSS